MADVFGVEVPDLDELDTGFQPLEAIVIMKGFSPEGEIHLVIANSEGITPWEKIGMAHMLKEDALSECGLVATGDDEDDEYS